MKRFKTQLAPPDADWSTGAASMGDIDPSDIAEKIFGPDMDGNLLFSYMFRRFGYPNTGWDDHKDLVAYALTTPMRGVFLGVRPHPAERKESTKFLFALRMNSQVYYKIRRTDLRHEKPRYDLIAKWAGDRFHGYEDPAPRVPGEWKNPILVREAMNDEERDVFGPFEESSWAWRMYARALEPIYESEHPGFHCDTLSIRRPNYADVREEQGQHTDFVWQLNRALDRALQDLLRPTNVRDYVFNVLGPCEDATQECEVFAKAGCTAQYLYGPP